jgi:uncharacterized tellurite resistance protein B-like protein
MFDALSRLFANDKPQTEPMDTKLATAALLVHLAAVDGIVTPAEHKKIGTILGQHFELKPDEVSQLVTEATHRDKDAVDFYQFTSALSKIDEQERLDIIRLMWQVVFADGGNHELEDNMVWRIAELIGVSNRQRTILRNQMKRAAD